MIEIIDKSILFEKYKVSWLAEKYGTPTYVYSENIIRDNFRRLQGAFLKYYDDFKIFYALKANNNPAIVSIFIQEGAGIDAASINEVFLAKKIGILNNDIIYTGNYISDKDIQLALEENIIINLDDISMLSRMLKYGKPEILSFRVNPGYGRSNVGSYGTTGGKDAKYGLHPEQVIEAYRKAKNAGVKRFGIHMMAGSCVTDHSYFDSITKLFFDIAKNITEELNINFEFVDVGGGFGVPYQLHEPPLDINLAAMNITKNLKNYCHSLKIPYPKLYIEPARYFMADAGILLGQVHTIKKSYKTIIGTDVGMNVLIRPVMFNAYHEIFFDMREGDPRQNYGLCGQLCDNTDYWIKDRSFPSTVKEGDILVITTAGAYCYSMSFQFNGSLRAAEVLINKESEFLIRHRESMLDMIRSTQIPTHLKIT